MLLLCKWLLLRASAIRELDLDFSNLFFRQGYCPLLPRRWVQVLAVVVRAASSTLEALRITLLSGSLTNEADPVGSNQQAVLAAQSCHSLKCEVRSCDGLKELDIRVPKLDGLLLSLLELDALPASLERLVLHADDAHHDMVKALQQPVNVPSAQESGNCLDLEPLGRLARLVHVELCLPFLIKVPAALLRVTSLHLSCKELTFSQGLAMPVLQNLHLDMCESAGASVQLPALHGLTAVTALDIGGHVVALDWLTLPHLRKCALRDTTFVAQQQMPMMSMQLNSLLLECWAPSFPVQVAELKALQSLSMPCICSTDLPSVITQLSNLQTLRLGRARLSGGSVGDLDASALGDLSAFPCLQYLEFKDCHVALAPCIGTHLPAKLQQLFFWKALPYATRGGRGVLALHRQLTALGRPGVPYIRRRLAPHADGGDDRAVWFGHALEMAASPRARASS